MVHSILPSKEIHNDDNILVGKTAEKLGEMSRTGIPLQPGFVITSSAYFTFLRTNHLPAKITDLLSTASYEHADSLQQVASHIQKLIKQTKLSDELVKEIYTNYAKLGGFFKHPAIIVSPSPTGQAQFIELSWHIQGEANLLVKIREIWALLFEAEALFFRQLHHINHFQTGMAIIVQK